MEEVWVGGVLKQLFNDFFDLGMFSFAYGLTPTLCVFLGTG